MRRVRALQALESRFEVHEVLKRGLRHRRVERERILAERDVRRIVAEDRPVAGFDRDLLVRRAVREVAVAVGDAVRVGDDDRRAVVGFGFLHGLEHLRVLVAERDARDVNVAVLHGDLREVLLRELLARRGEFRDRRDRGGLGHLSARVGIDFRVEDENLDVLARGDRVVESSVADVVRPAVAADDPDVLLDEEFGKRGEALGFRRSRGFELLVQLGDAFALRGDVGFGDLRRFENRLGEFFADRSRGFGESLARDFGLLVDRVAHAEAEFGVVFEQRVRPGRAAAVLIDGVRRRGQVAAVNRGAAGGVGDVGAVAEELRHQLDVGRFAARGAGAGEFDERRHELRVADRVAELRAVRIGKIHEEVPVLRLGFAQRRLGRHHERVARRIVLVLAGADVRADRAARAVFRSDLDGEQRSREVLRLEGHALEGFGGARLERFRVELRADRGVRTDRHALVALNAEFRIPDGNLVGEVALFETRRRGGELAVRGHRGRRDEVALVRDHHRLHALEEFRRALVFRERLRLRVGVRRRGNVDFMQVGERVVHRLEVHLHDFLALLGVGLFDGLLDLRDGFVLRENVREREEARLHDGVRAALHAGFGGDLRSVDDEDAELLGDDLLLPFLGEALPGFRGRERRVQQNRRSRHRVFQNRLAADEDVLRARHEARLLDEVGGTDRTRAETQVGDRRGAGLLGVVHEVALREVRRLFADDLDGVLVRADRAVRAEADEDRALDVVRLDVERVVPFERGVRQVVVDADREAFLRSGLGELVVDRLDHARVEFLGADAVAAADDGRHRLAGFGVGGEDVEQQRFAERAGFLRAVEHGEALRRRGNGLQERFRVERQEQADLDEAELRALRVERVDRLFDRFAGRAHGDDDAVRVRSSVVVIKVILAAGDFRELVHEVLDDSGNGVVVFVDGFAALEIDVRILRGAVDVRALRRHGAGAEGGDVLFVDDGADFVVGKRLNLGDFVRGAEAVEEVHERHARLERSRVGNERHVLRLLPGSGVEHDEARRAAAHHVGVVAEDRERVRRERARRHVHRERNELAGDLVHVGDHQQQALRGGERRRQRAREQRAVHGARDAGLGLKLLDTRGVVPEIGHLLRRPFVARFRHRGGRRNRVNRDYLAESVGDGSDGFVRVHRFEFGCRFCHNCRNFALPPPPIQRKNAREKKNAPARGALSLSFAP